MYKPPKLKDVTQFGKIFLVISNPKKNNIQKPTPMLHYIIYKKDDGFRALCLDLGIGCFNFTEEEVHSDLRYIIREYLTTIYFKAKSTKQLEDDLKSIRMEEFWVLYRLKYYERAMKNKLPDEVIDSHNVLNLINQLNNANQTDKDKNKTIRQLNGLMQDIVQERDNYKNKSDSLQTELDFSKSENQIKQSYINDLEKKLEDTSQKKNAMI